MLFFGNQLRILCATAVARQAVDGLADDRVVVFEQRKDSSMFRFLLFFLSLLSSSFLLFKNINTNY